jgi:hypothetical protein
MSCHNQSLNPGLEIGHYHLESTKNTFRKHISLQNHRSLPIAPRKEDLGYTATSYRPYYSKRKERILSTTGSTLTTFKKRKTPFPQSQTLPFFFENRSHRTPRSAKRYPPKERQYAKDRRQRLFSTLLVVRLASLASIGSAKRANENSHICRYSTTQDQEGNSERRKKVN